ncbi:MAG: radical SAM protein [Candidatus Nanoarchaeia archaeon]
MVTIEFSRFSFFDDKQIVRGLYGGRYSFSLPKNDFLAIDSDVIISKKEITFPSIGEKSANNKLHLLLDRALHSLTNTVTKKPTIYVDKQSQIPLIGAVDFGIIDRNTNIIEIKTHTGCNFNCVYCSVNEGKNKKSKDILVDDNYLLRIASQIALTKKHPVEFNINPNGEPLLYPFLEDLILGLKNIPTCEVISINTNASLLTKEKIDALQNAGLSRLNISLNTLDAFVAKRISGGFFNLNQTLEMIRYAQSIGLPVLLAPLIVPTYNDRFKEDLHPLVKFASSLKSPFPTIAFQKYLENKSGRNPVKEIPFEDFFASLRPLEKGFNMVLTPQKDYNPFHMYSDTKLIKPFVKNDVVSARILCQGRTPREIWCEKDNRLIKVKGLTKFKGNAKVKIVRDKHNIFLGVPA